MSNKTRFISIICLLFIVGCGGNSKSGNQSDTFIIVDVKADYPQKELILQDFMDVEYIALETTDEFLCQNVILAVGKEYILIRNSINDGDIFIFDRNGKGIRKINRHGQGPEEYVRYDFNKVTLDEENKEIFIDDQRRIVVYDLYGKFLRSFKRTSGANYSSLNNYDRDHLICRESSVRNDETSTESRPYAIISKKDGSMVHDIRIYFKQSINPFVTSDNGEWVFILPSYFNSIVPFKDSWVLIELASDTIFRLLSDYSLTPFIERVPPVHSMNPEIFLIPIILTDRYYFLETLKKEIVTGQPGEPFPKTKLMYDRQEKTMYKYTVYNDDYTTKRTLSFSSLHSNNEVAFVQTIDVLDLIELNKKGELKGKLKEVATELDEDSNPVVMLVKYKK